MDPLHRFERVMKVVMLCIILAFVSLLAARVMQGQMSPYDEELSQQLRGVHSPVLSPDGRSVAYVRTTTDARTGNRSSDVVIVSVADRRELAVFAGSAPRWNAAGTELAYVVTRATGPELWTRTIATGAMRIISIAAANGDEADVPPTADFAWAPDGRTLYVLAHVRDGAQLTSADALGGTPTPLLRCACALAQLSIDTAGTIASLVRSSATEPPDVWTIALTAGATATPLTRANARVVLEALMTEAQTFMAAGPHGDSLLVHLLPPAAMEPGQRFPVVLQLLDTAHGAGVYAFDDHAQLLSTGGYGVVSIVSRDASANPDAWRDQLTGLDAAIARYAWIDTTRVGLMGLGGSAALARDLVTRTTRFRATVRTGDVSTPSGAADSTARDARTATLLLGGDAQHVRDDERRSDRWFDRYLKRDMPVH